MRQQWWSKAIRAHSLDQSEATVVLPQHVHSFFSMTSAEENKSREERKKTNKQTKTLLEIKHSAKKNM
jgi:hypothetical protein